MNSFYFPHDYQAKSDQKLLDLRAEFGAKGYGIWWMILETLAQQDEGINREGIGGLSLDYNVDKETLQNVLDFCIDKGLLYEEDNMIRNDRMDKHKEMREKYRKAGKKGAEKRWSNNKQKGGNSPPNGKESKGNEKKDNKEKNEKKKNTPKKEYGNPKVNEVVEYLESYVGRLEKSQKRNRQRAWNLIQRIESEFPNAAPVESIKKLIDVAMEDNFHSANCTNFRYLFNNYKKIMKSYEQSQKKKKAW